MLTRLKPRRHHRMYLVLLLLVTSQIGCADQDPLSLSDGHLAGDYCLHQQESDYYWLINPSATRQYLVSELGSNEKYIVGRLDHSHATSREERGRQLRAENWVVVDYRSYQERTLTDQQFQMEFAVTTIRLLPAGLAWSQLRHGLFR